MNRDGFHPIELHEIMLSAAATALIFIGYIWN